ISRWWPSILFAVALAGFGAWWIRQEESHSQFPIVILILLILGLQLALLYADRPNVGAELVDRTLSKASNGYVATAGELSDLNETLRNFPAIMPAFDNDHARTHPPGFIVAHSLTDRLLQRSPMLAQRLARPVTYWRCTDLWVLSRPASSAASLLIWSWIPSIMAALIVIPAHRLARRWFAPVPARMATLLVASLPALLIFVPSADQLFACLSLLSLLLLVAGLGEQRPALVLLSGIIVSLMSFLSLGNVAWAALLGAYTLLWLFWPAQSPVKGFGEAGMLQRRLAPAASYLLGAASFWLVYWLGWGVAPWEIARVGLEQHHELVTSLRRYDWWLGYNLIDLLLFAGLPVALGLLWRATEGFGDKAHLRDDGRIAVLLVALLLAINLAGTTRGEVGRLWLVFMPTAAVIAGGMFGRRITDRPGLWLLLAAQIVLVLSIALAWRPFFAVILPVERPAMVASGPAVPLDVSFLTPDNRQIQLSGYTIGGLDFALRSPLEVTLHWQSDGPTLGPYVAFVQLLSSDGTMIAQHDAWPVGGAWPTTCWINGEAVIDRHQIDLPDEAESGRYKLIAGLYDAAGGDRLVASNGADAIELLEIAFP
ncbi:MAG TPA: hypothetical protein VF434_00480, partial [Promineifilum sp.]